MSRVKDNPQIGRTYLQIIHQMRGSDPKYVRNWDYSVTRKQITLFKYGQRTLKRPFSKEDIKRPEIYEKVLNITNHQGNVN
jgi:hypothetical protein